MTHLWRDPDTGQYGVARVARPDGTYSRLRHASPTT